MHVSIHLALYLINDLTHQKLLYIHCKALSLQIESA